MRAKIYKILLAITAILMLATNLGVIYFMIKTSQNIPNQIKDTVRKEVNLITIPKDGYTPIKGIDYFDGLSVKGEQGIAGKDGMNGANGINGVNGQNGYTPVKGIDYIDGQDGVDGKTPILRCNISKDRWEVSYNNGISWQISLSENKKPVKCNI